MTAHLAYDAAWGLDKLVFSVGDKSRFATPAPVLELEIPDEWVGHEIELVAVGMRAGNVIASGRARTTPQRGATVEVMIQLLAGGCGDACLEGSTQCQADAVMQCTRDEIGCTHWTLGEPCAASCSNGACVATCSDECAAGEATCPSATQRAVCGNSDRDPCTDWLAPEPCAAGTTCSAGQCRATCVDACTLGARKCGAQGPQTCVDTNHDGCAEWGPEAPCPADQACSDGACAATCRDECSAPRCTDNRFEQCGNYDNDPCREFSVGETCVSTDLCQVGSCTAAGCRFEALRCATGTVCRAGQCEAACTDASTTAVCEGNARRTCERAPGATCKTLGPPLPCADGCADGACVACSCQSKVLTETEASYRLVVTSNYLYWAEAFDWRGTINESTQRWQANLATGQVTKLTDMTSLHDADESGIVYKSFYDGLCVRPHTMDSPRCARVISSADRQSLLRLDNQRILIALIRPIQYGSTHHVVVIDRATLTTLKTIDLPKPVTSIASGDAWYVATEGGVIYRIGKTDYAKTSAVVAQTSVSLVGVDAQAVYWVARNTLYKMANTLTGVVSELHSEVSTPALGGGRIYWPGATHIESVDTSGNQHRIHRAMPADPVAAAPTVFGNTIYYQANPEGYFGVDLVQASSCCN